MSRNLITANIEHGKRIMVLSHLGHPLWNELHAQHQFNLSLTLKTEI